MMRLTTHKRDDKDQFILLQKIWFFWSIVHPLPDPTTD